MSNDIELYVFTEVLHFNFLSDIIHRSVIKDTNSLPVIIYPKESYDEKIIDFICGAVDCSL